MGASMEGVSIGSGIRYRNREPEQSNQGAIFGAETAAQNSARNIAEQTAYRKALNSQWRPPSGFSSFGGRGGRGGAGDNLEIPAYDEQKVESLAQRVAAPSVRRLRNEVQTVQGGVYENPNVKALTLRQALGGYGQGLENVMGGAFGTASNIYNQEYQPQVRAAEISYQAKLQRDLQRERLDAKYRDTWNDYMRNLQE